MHFLIISKNMDKIHLYRKVVQPWHAITPNCRSRFIEHTKIYFTIFGATKLKIWINYDFNQFLGNLLKWNRLKTLRAPGFKLSEALTGGTLRSTDPTCQPHRASAAVDRPGSHHRWGLRWPREHLRLPKRETNLTVPFLALDKHRSYLAVGNGGHGGAARRGLTISLR